MLPPAAVGVVTRPLPRLRLVDRPLNRSFLKTGSVLARYERQFVDGSRVFFRGGQVQRETYEQP